MEVKQKNYKPKCSVWQYWHSEEDENGVKLAKCKFCSQVYTASAAKNATRLRQHLTRRCPNVPEEVKLSFPEDIDERIKTKDTPKTSNKSDDSCGQPKRKSLPRKRTAFVPEVKIEEQSEDEYSRDDQSIASSPRRDKTKDTKALEDENERLSSKLKICLQQKEALLQINKFLDQSLSLMRKMDSIQKNFTTDCESEIDELNQQLISCHNSVKDWKQKYNLIEYNHKMKKMCQTSASASRLSTSSVWDEDSTGEDRTSSKTGHRPQSTIWRYFKNMTKESDDFKTIKCKFCEKEFRYKALNATKCRTHIVENCESVPEDVRLNENNWIEYRPQSKVLIWQHFSVTEDEDKTTVECVYCGHTYSGRNATKCRSHLVGKCESVPDYIRDAITNQCDTNFVTNSQVTPKQKMSNIWKHFDIEEDEGKISCVCIYCRHLFCYKNATKSRRHLLDKCPAIPRDIRLDINSEIEESGRTWTQTKIPIRDHFESLTRNGKESVRCIYCGFVYGHKNATKLRMHLLSKCADIPDENRERIREQCQKSYLNGMQNKSEIKLKIIEKKVRKIYTKNPNRVGAGGRRKCFIWEHFNELNDETGVSFECSYCKHTFKYRNATKMKQHLANSCKFVPEDIKNNIKELDDGSVRPYTKRVQSTQGLHECCWPGCDLTFTKMSRLRSHQMSHTGVIQRIRCDWPGCDWTGRSKSDVKIHRCIHTGEKPYVCDWPGCDFKTAKPSSLWIHKRRHKELFKFPCDWPGCERQFLTSWERKRHKNTHLGLKPFGCQYCDKRYPIAYKLKVHQNKHHINQMGGR